MATGLVGSGLIPGRVRILPFSILFRPALGSAQQTGVVKQLGSEADHSPPSTAVVKNGGAVPLDIHKYYPYGERPNVITLSDIRVEVFRTVTVQTVLFCAVTPCSLTG
jgi:hypothetical protein